MKNFENFRYIYSLIIATTASILCAFFINYLQEKIKADIKLSFFLTILVVSIIITIINIGVEKLIDNSQTFRKMIDPTNFIEGHWYDKTYNGDKLVHVVILNICYEKGNFSIYGETFDGSKNHIANFTTTQTAFSNKQLFAFVNVNYTGRGNDSGIDHYIFGSPSTSYTCSYIEFHNPSGLKRTEVSGEKISESKMRRYNHLETLPDRKEFISSIL